MALSHPLLSPLRRIHERIRERVVDACTRSALEEMSGVVAEDDADTIYAVDRIGEAVLLDCFADEIDEPLVLVAEGLTGGMRVLPEGTSPREAAWRVIVDPIDGTRGLMYQKRSAWILTGVARNHGDQTSLADIELAVQTEIPLVRQHLSEAAWAVRGQGVEAEQYDRIAGARTPRTLRPSRARTLAHGFATIARFFPGARAELAAIDDEIARAVCGPVRRGRAQYFEDQYISTGGQLFELMAGRDRFVADLRPLMEPVLARRGQALGICCHPYDLCTALIAQEAGVEVVTPAGDPLGAPLDVTTEVAWAGYANAALRALVEPHLTNALRRRELIPLAG